VSLLALMMKSNVMATPRLMSAFYLLLIPSVLLNSSQSVLVRKSWWRICGLLVFFVAGSLVVLTPSRPLWPAKWVFSSLLLKCPDNPVIQRASRVYSVYAERNEAFAPILRLLPPETRTIGLVATDEPEATLWRPYGSRRIVHVVPGTLPEDLKRMGVSYVVLNREVFDQCFNRPLENWLREFSGTTVANVPLDLRAHNSASKDWALIKL
jgi:hypothetical protein